MKEIDDSLENCSFCHFPQNTPQEYPDALAPGTELGNRFLIGKELGRGGFGITYVGYDKYLDCKVAIKEFIPQALAARLPGEVKLFWTNSQQRDSGCQNVIREAQKMHRIGVLPVAVHVLDVFYENNTAYIAMDYVDGVTLKEYLMKNGVLSPKECMEIVLPILDTMVQMHEAGIIHRDISPDNIMIQPDLQPRILDLGAAKDAQIESGNTILVARNGFSPMEQYRTNGEIGEWTDVYALCATIYYSLTGKVPQAAMDRGEDDDALLFAPDCQLPEKLRQVLQDGMQMQVAKRIPDMKALKRRLEDSLDVTPDGELKIQPPEPPVQEHVVWQSTDSLGGCVQTQEKPEGRFLVLNTVFGRKKRAPAKKVKRKPTAVAIAQRDAMPAYADPDATVCADTVDNEETVLVGSETPAFAKGVLVQNSTGRSVEITKSCFVLGRMLSTAASSRQPTADCMIEDRAKHISRRHAAILFNGEHFYIQDISRKNSTLLNGVRLQNGMMPEHDSVFPVAYRLYHGDCIQLADEKLTFYMGGGT